MQLEVRRIHAPYSDQTRGPTGFCIRCGAVEDRLGGISLFPLLGLVVAALPIDVGAEFQRIIEGVDARGEANDMRSGRRSQGAGLVACPVDVGGITSGAASGAARAAARFHIPNRPLTAGVLRPQPARDEKEDYTPAHETKVTNSLHRAIKIGPLWVQVRKGLVQVREVLVQLGKGIVHVCAGVCRGTSEPP